MDASERAGATAGPTRAPVNGVVVQMLFASVPSPPHGDPARGREAADGEGSGPGTVIVGQQRSLVTTGARFQERPSGCARAAWHDAPPARSPTAAPVNRDSGVETQVQGAAPARQGPPPAAGRPPARGSLAGAAPMDVCRGHVGPRVELAW